MDSVALWFHEGSNNEERIQRKILRDHSNIMSLCNKSFIRNFRLNKDAFMYVLSSIERKLKVRQRSSGIPPIVKLSAALKFLAQGGYQHQIGQDCHVGLAQQTFSSCFSEICLAIEKVLCPRHIVFEMTEGEKREARIFFYENGIPRAIAVVDGTHIQMIRPANQEHLYFNRKLKHSLNAMIICDHKMMIKAVDGRFGGASHDSHVWNLSAERQFLMQNYQNGERETWILGDSAYPLEPWILTPYRNTLEGSGESLFNQNFSKARCIIERTFGVLKGRFRCLLAARELHYSPQTVARILNVCYALHSICLLYNIELPSNLPEEPEEALIPLNIIANTTDSNASNIAKRIRDQIRNNMITQG